MAVAPKKNTDDFSRIDRKKDVELKEKELELREIEANSKRIEAEAKVRESTRRITPFTAAIFAAAIAGIANAVVAYFNGLSQYSIEDYKAEASRILEVIKTEPDKAAVNLQFLIDTGLIAPGPRREGLVEYLKNRKVGTGPSLPDLSGYSPSSFAQVAAPAGMAEDKVDEYCKSHVPQAYIGSWIYSGKGGMSTEVGPQFSCGYHWSPSLSGSGKGQP